MPAGILDTRERDAAQVVAVVENLVDSLDGGRPLRQPDRCGHGEAAVRQFLRQLPQRVLAERECLEGPADVGCPRLIELNDADVLAVDAVTGVAVAHGAGAWRA